MTKLLLDNIVFSLQPTGGISIVWSELLKRAVRDADFDLHILAYPNHNKQYGELSLSVDQLINMPYRTMERYRQPDFTSSADTVFHSSYFRILPTAHNITTIHDLTYHYYRRGLAKAVHLWEEERALRHSDHVICVSDNTRRDLLRTYAWLDESKVSVIYNGVSDSFRPLDVEESVTPFDKGEYLLYVGNRKGYKNWEVAADVARAAGMPLVMVGAALEEKEKAFLIDRLGEGRFACMGVMSEQQLCTLYNQAFALLYPSDYEGFGLPVVEAQRCGCPVIIQAVSSLPEVAGEGALMVSTNKDHSRLTDDMAHLIGELQQGRLSRSELQKRGFENARRFSWDECYNATKQIYQSVGK